jgi:Tol biopolymer transport system component
MRTTLSSGSLFAVFLAFALPAPATETMNLDFVTREVTESDVALSPDGNWLVVTLLGHLHRLPIHGGRAEQLTFGPFYDSSPVFAPGGSCVAFVSDRDGSEGDIFVLETFRATTSPRLSPTSPQRATVTRASSAGAPSAPTAGWR